MDEVADPPGLVRGKERAREDPGGEERRRSDRLRSGIQTELRRVEISLDNESNRKSYSHQLAVRISGLASVPEPDTGSNGAEPG